MEIRNRAIDSYNRSFEYLDFKLITLSTVIGILNSFFYNDLAIMILLSILEIGLCMLCLIRKDYANFLGIYTLALCFSLESSNYVGDSIFYSFKNIRIFGLNLAVWVLLPLFILVILNFNKLLNMVNKINRNLIRKLGMYTFLAVIIGMITYLANDNGISSQDGSISVLINVAYTYLLPFFEICVVSLLLFIDSTRTIIVKKYMYAVIVADTIVFAACMVFGNFGNRGGLASLQVSEVSFLVACALVTIVYDDFQKIEKVILTICGAVTILLSLIYNSSGKLIFVVTLTPIAMIVILKRKGVSPKTIVGGIIALFAFLFVVLWLLPILIQENQLLGIKFNQFSSFIAFGPNWLNNMAESPKMRITEFMNICSEFMKKPWFLPFGKGCCGTIKDNLNLFSNLTSFAFSEWELRLGAYYSMHESINTFFLTGGIFGLYVLLSICHQLYRNIEKSPWLVIGLIWLLLFYVYHMSISFYGIMALIIGISDIYKMDYDL